MFKNNTYLIHKKLFFTRSRRSYL